MAKYIVKRVLLSLLILFGVSIIIYAMVRMMPTDYVDNKMQSQVAQGVVNEEDILRMKQLYGLDDNSFFGIIGGYFKWLGKALSGDLGVSFKYGEPVSKVIGDYMWISFAISIIATVLQYLFAIPLGIRCATRQYGKLDYIATVLAMVCISLPSFFFAVLLLKIFSVDLGWFPLQGLVDPTKGYANGSFAQFMDKVHHLIIPITVLTVLGIGGLMRHTRTNTLEVLTADYIRTARAKGLSEGKVIYKHAFRNTMIPLVTMMAGMLPAAFGGAIITEQVFAIPGIGLKAYDALKFGDIPFIMGYQMFLAILTVIGTLLSDLMYAVVDPRVKLAR